MLYVSFWCPGVLYVVNTSDVINLKDANYVTSVMLYPEEDVHGHK